MDIKWEDEDSGFDEKEIKEVKAKTSENVSEFSKLFESGDFEKNEVVYQPGDEVRVFVKRVGDREIMVEMADGQYGIISADEVFQSAPKPGDSLKAFIVDSLGQELVLTLNPSQKLKHDHGLEAAFDSSLPIKGKVLSSNKGGFEVKFGSKKAFCPISQIDSKFVTEPSNYVGKEFDFIITKLSGRDAVCSRRVLLEKEAEKNLTEIIEGFNTNPDRIIAGEVASLKDFGAFVDIGGMQGLVHISELTHGRPKHPKDVVKVGDKVKVKILKLEDHAGKKKISLSMRAVSQSPWADAGTKYKVGSDYPVKIVSLVDYGAFVSLEEGVEGFVHISEFSWNERFNKASDFLKLGDEKTARIISIDPQACKMALTFKQAQEDPWIVNKEKIVAGSEVFAKVVDSKKFGAIVEIFPSVTALLPISALKEAFGAAYRKQMTMGLEIQVKIAEVDLESKRILVTLPSLEKDDSGLKDYEDYLKHQAERKEKSQTSTASGGTLGEFFNK